MPENFADVIGVTNGPGGGRGLWPAEASESFVVRRLRILNVDF